MPAIRGAPGHPPDHQISHTVEPEPVDRERHYAAAADVPGNSFAGPSGFMEGRGAPKLVGRSKAAQDADIARRLWDVSAELTGVRFPLAAASLAA